jgi:hypothetical protein
MTHTERAREMCGMSLVHENGPVGFDGCRQCAKLIAAFVEVEREARAAERSLWLDAIMVGEMLDGDTPETMVACALDAAAHAQMESDCRAVCIDCRSGLTFEPRKSDAEWVHVAPRSTVWCAAFSIREAWLAREDK